MDIKHLQYLLEIDRCRSLRQASEQLYISVQQLSRILKAIEDEYQIQIFERTNLGLKPTMQGMTFIEKVKFMLRQDDVLHRIGCSADSADLLTGTLSIYSSPNMWNLLQNCIGKFATSYPNVAIDHYIKGESGIIKGTKETPNSVGLYVYWSNGSSEEALVELGDEYDIYPLSESRISMYCSANHPIARKNGPMSLRSLLGEDFVIYKPYSEDDYFFNKIFAAMNCVSPKVKYKASDKSIVYTLLRETECIYIGAELPDVKRDDKLVMISLREELILGHKLLIHKSYADSSITQAFQKVAIDYYKDLL